MWVVLGALPLTFGTKLLKEPKEFLKEPKLLKSQNSWKPGTSRRVSRSHAFADDSKTSAHLSHRAYKRRLSISMDATIIFHYQEQISIDAKGSCV